MAGRMRRLRAALAAGDVEALVVTHRPNVYYLCGFTGSAAVLVVAAGGAALFTDGRYAVQAREEVRGARVHIVRGGLLAAAGQWLALRKFRIAGFEAAHLSVADKRLLAGHATRVRWKPLVGVVEGLRAVKDPGEIELMRAAARLGSQVFEAILPLVRPGRREMDLAAEVDYRIRRGGGSGAAFETIVASGPRSALPHARPSLRRLRKNELVVLDLGAILRHYCCDLTRTVYLGRAPRKIRQWYGAVREAQAAAIAALRAGIATGEPDRAARAVLRRAGLERRFVHSLGHGLGLEVHEHPRLAAGQKQRLEAGNVVTIEPGVYVPGTGGIRIEDDVVITERGAQVLTTASRDSWELG